MKKGLVIALILLGLIGLERTYFIQNRGFRVSKLISPQLAVYTPAPEVSPYLDQPFHFLGAGGTSFVFLGEDGKTILKLFKHQHLFYKESLFYLPCPGLSDGMRLQKILWKNVKFRHKRHPFFFNSCALALDHLKQETGLIYASVQPNSYFDRKVTLIDAWGIPHSVNLSRTEFAVQQKAELLLPYLGTLLQQGKKEEARQAIDSLVSLIVGRCKKGIGDRDPNLRINFGFIEGRAVEIDLGSYEQDAALKSPHLAAKELFFVTSALQAWLEAREPELASHLLDRVAEISGQSH